MFAFDRASHAEREGQTSFWNSFTIVQVPSTFATICEEHSHELPYTNVILVGREPTTAPKDTISLSILILPHHSVSTVHTKGEKCSRTLASAVHCSQSSNMPTSCAFIVAVPSRSHKGASYLSVFFLAPQKIREREKQPPPQVRPGACPLPPARAGVQQHSQSSSFGVGPAGKKGSGRDTENRPPVIGAALETRMDTARHKNTDEMENMTTCTHLNRNVVHWLQVQKVCKGGHLEEPNLQ